MNVNVLMMHCLMRSLLLSSILVTPLLGQAATLYLDPGFTTLYRGDAVKVAVRLNVNQQAGECINAVDGVLTYSDNIQPVDVSLGDSIFSIWVEPPTINRENRTITFAGGIPNGYCGRVQGDPSITNTIAEIVFRSPGMVVGGVSGGDALVEFAPETRALLNDGFGTNAPLTTIGARFVMESTPGSTLEDPWRDAVAADTLPPEEFSITLVKDDLIHSQQYYIVFTTTDKQTGIAEYEVMEEPLEDFWAFRWGRTDAPWVRPTGQNTHVLQDQSLNSVIRVRAIDKAGTEYIATLVPEEALRTMSTQRLLSYILYAAVGAVLLVVVGILVYVIQRRRTRRVVSSTDQESDDVAADVEADQT